MGAENVVLGCDNVLVFVGMNEVRMEKGCGRIKVGDVPN